MTVLNSVTVVRVRQVKHVVTCFYCRHAFIQRIAKSLSGCWSSGRCRGYQSWTHSGSSHAGEVALSAALSMAVYTKANGQTNSAPDNNTPQKPSSCPPPTVCLLFHVLRKKVKETLSHFHHQCAQSTQYLNKIYKSRAGREVRLHFPSQKAGAHKRSSSLQPIN